jgi:hypothetical protein
VSFRRSSGIVIQAAALLWVAGPAVPAALTAGTAVNNGRATVTIVGRAGSFGPDRDTLPSGQSLGRLDAPRWDFPAARKPGAAVLAGDGSLLMPAVSHNDSLTVPTSPEMAVSAYDPRTNTSETIALASTTGVLGARGLPQAATVTALVPMPDGSVAFTAWTEGVETAAPVFGLLTKVDGHWRSLPANRWKARGIGISRPLSLARLPGSGDLVVAHDGGILTALRLTGPDLDGGYGILTRGSLRHPAAGVTIREVHADPTRERFVASLDRPDSPAVVQEFGYDNGTGAISVLSAPLLPGDEHEISKRSYAYKTAVYDRGGNLWVIRTDRGLSGNLAVYTRERCKPDAGPWGRVCRPDYDIVQARELRSPRALVEETASGTMVLMTDGGQLMPVRAKASGDRLEFAIGNLVDIGGKLLTDGEGSIVDSRPGVVDRDGRLWFPVSRAEHDNGGGTRTRHWMFAVRLGELFDPPATRLADVPGRRVTIQAENTLTVSTTQGPGRAAAVDVHSDAFVAECHDALTSDCGYDPTPGNGFFVLDESRYGRRGGTLSYRIDVPAAGRYRLSYQVGTFAVSTRAGIRMTTAARSYVTAVATDGDWRPKRSDDLVWLDAGVQTVSIEPAEGGGGWFLNSLTLQRV